MATYDMPWRPKLEDTMLYLWTHPCKEAYTALVVRDGKLHKFAAVLHGSDGWREDNTVMSPTDAGFWLAPLLRVLGPELARECLHMHLRRVPHYGPTLAAAITTLLDNIQEN